MSQPKRIFVVAGEHSGDVLGGKLLEALKAKAGAEAFVFAGVGGEHMEAAGLRSIFPMSDVVVMGLAGILARLPKLVRRVYQTVDAALAFNPDVLVIIDSPEFTHQIAKRVRKRQAPNSHRGLCEPERLGVAPGPRPQDAALCRPPGGAVALRAGSACEARRPGLHLCRPPAHRKNSLDQFARYRRIACAAWSNAGSACAGGPARQPRQRSFAADASVRRGHSHAATQNRPSGAYIAGGSVGAPVDRGGAGGVAQAPAPCRGRGG